VVALQQIHSHKSYLKKKYFRIINGEIEGDANELGVLLDIPGHIFVCPPARHFVMRLEGTPFEWIPRTRFHYGRLTLSFSSLPDDLKIEILLQCRRSRIQDRAGRLKPFR